MAEKQTLWNNQEGTLSLAQDGQAGPVTIAAPAASSFFSFMYSLLACPGRRLQDFSKYKLVPVFIIIAMRV